MNAYKHNLKTNLKKEPLLISCYHKYCIIHRIAFYLYQIGVQTAL